MQSHVGKVGSSVTLFLLLSTLEFLVHLLLALYQFGKCHADLHFRCWVWHDLRAIQEVVSETHQVLPYLRQDTGGWDPVSHSLGSRAAAAENSSESPCLIPKKLGWLRFNPAFYGVMKIFSFLSLFLLTTQLPTWSHLSWACPSSGTEL